MRPTLLTVLPLCAVLSACATGGAEGSGTATSAAAAPLVRPMAEGAVCNPEVLDSYVGKEASQAILDDARTRSGALHVRVGKPGMAMTMDFRQDRLTVHVNADNRIESISCG